MISKKRRMIEKLSLKNFKGIRKGLLNLSQLTILLGANNSGKTTILEALFLAPNPFRRVPYNTPHSTAAEVITILHKTLKTEGFAFLLTNYIENEAEIRCSIKGEEIWLKFIKIGDKIYVSTNKKEIPFNDIYLPDIKIRYFGALSASSRSYDCYYSEKFLPNSLLISPKLVKLAQGYIEMNWIEIANRGVGTNVAKEVSEFSDEKYKDITIEPFLGGYSAIYAYREDGVRIRLGDLGDGIQNYIISRMLYELEKPDILLWDDIEAHFNPRIIAKIAEWFYDIIEEGKQVILATHSIEAAKMIAGVNEEFSKIYILKLKNGILSSEELSFEDLIGYEEAGIDMRVL